MMMIVAADDAAAAVFMSKVNVKDYWLDHDDVVMALWTDGYFIMYLDRFMEMSGYSAQEFG
jgi:hypothetical protein